MEAFRKLWLRLQKICKEQNEEHDQNDVKKENI